MSFYGYSRNSGIPRLLSFEDALKWHEAVAPIRTINYKANEKEGTEKHTNRHAGKRPLGLRRNTWFQINRINEGKPDEAIVCIMHSEPIVTFFKDGEIEIRNYSYNTTSTANFLSDVFGMHNGVNAWIHDYGLVIGVKDVDDQNKFAKLLPTDTMRMKRVKTRWEITDCKPVVTHTLNRKVLGELRAKYAEVYEYFRNYTKLIGEIRMNRASLQEEDTNLGAFRLDGGWWSARDDFVKSAKLVNECLNDKSDERYESYYKVLTALVPSCASFDWNRQVFALDDATKLPPTLDKLIMGLHRDKVMVAKPDETGGRRDRYGHLWRRGWGAYHKGRYIA
jgi:hypothetical protein